MSFSVVLELMIELFHDWIGTNCFEERLKNGRFIIVCLRCRQWEIQFGLFHVVVLQITAKKCTKRARHTCSHDFPFTTRRYHLVKSPISPMASRYKLTILFLSTRKIVIYYFFFVCGLKKVSIVLYSRWN